MEVVLTNFGRQEEVKKRLVEDGTVTKGEEV